MAGRCDMLLREVKMPRIDHSQIYLENDRLKEALDHLVEDLDRRQYRQWMSREEEIQKLKKASGLFNQEDLDDRGHPIASRRSMQRARSVGRMHNSTASAGDKPSSSRPNTRESGLLGHSRRSISVKVPTADDSDDGFSDIDSDVADGFLDPGPFGRNLRRPQAVLRSLEEKLAPRKAPFHGSSPSKPRRLNLEALMESLRLREYPKEWYSMVLEAADVPARKAVTSAKSTPMHSGRGKRSRPQTSGGAISRGATPASRRDLASRHTVDGSGSGLVSFSTVVCQGQQKSKTKRQLLEMVNQGVDSRPKSAVEQRLHLNRENSKLLDSKVKDFVKSLEEINKRNRKNDILDQL